MKTDAIKESPKISTSKLKEEESKVNDESISLKENTGIINNNIEENKNIEELKNISIKEEEEKKKEEESINEAVKRRNELLKEKDSQISDELTNKIIEARKRMCEEFCRYTHEKHHGNITQETLEEICDLDCPLSKL